MNEGLAVPVRALKVQAYKIPAKEPESDGTLEWDSTTLVVVEAYSEDKIGLGYSYAHASIAPLINDKLKPLVEGANAFDVPGIHLKLQKSMRNIGITGLAASSIAAVDTALWDLKARLLALPLCDLLGKVKDSVALYGSGGFTSYSLSRLKEQMEVWLEEGFKMMKMKVGRNSDEDQQRVKAVIEALNNKAELFVDANGAFHPKEALNWAHIYGRLGVKWFEEPVTSDDLDGLKFIKNNSPSNIEITAGEYGYNLHYFKHMLENKAVDVLQADVTRCCGITTLLQVDTLCSAYNVPLSTHTAPALHLHPSLAMRSFIHSEYFYDHVRIENMLFEGVRQPEDGKLIPDFSAAGNGLVFKWKDAEKYAVNL